MDSIPERLRQLLYVYCDVNAPEMIDTLRDRIRNGEMMPDEVDAIRSSLAGAIRGRTVSPEQYKALTQDNEYVTSEAVAEHLQELFAEIFEGESVPEIERCVK